MDFVMIQRALREDEAWNELSLRLRGVVATCAAWADPNTGIVAGSLSSLRNRVAPRCAERHVARWIEALGGFVEPTPAGAYRLTDRVLRLATTPAREPDPDRSEMVGATAESRARTAADRQADHRERERIAMLVVEKLAPMLPGARANGNGAAANGTRIALGNAQANGLDGVTSGEIDVTSAARDVTNPTVTPVPSPHTPLYRDSESETDSAAARAGVTSGVTPGVTGNHAAAAVSTASGNGTTPNDAVDALICALVQRGVNESVAKRFAKDRPEECRRQIHLTDPVPDSAFTANRGAYLKYAIENRAQLARELEDAVEAKRRALAEDEKRRRTQAERAEAEARRRTEEEAEAQRGSRRQNVLAGLDDEERRLVHEEALRLAKADPAGGFLVQEISRRPDLAQKLFAGGGGAAVRALYAPHLNALLDAIAAGDVDVADLARPDDDAGGD